MAFADSTTYWLVGLAVSVIFILGVFIQAFSIYLLLGAIFSAIAVLMHIGKEAYVLYETIRKGSANIRNEKHHGAVKIAFTGAWGCLGFFLIYFAKDALGETVWLVFLFNEAVYALMMLLPQLIMFTLPEQD